MKIIGWFFLFFSSSFCLGQSKIITSADTILAKNYLKKGDEYYNKIDYKNSSYYYKKAGETYAILAKINNDSALWERHIQSQLYLSWNLTEADKKYDEAINILKLSLETCLTELGNTHEHIAKLLYQISICHQHKGSYDISIEYIDKAIEARKIFLGKKQVDLRLASYYNGKGLLHNYKGSYELVLENYKIALEIFKEKLPEKHIHIAATYNNIGLFYWNKASYDLALNYFQKALSIYKETIGEKHPKAASTFHNIGNIYWYRDGSFNLAMEYYNKSLSIKKEVYPIDHPLIGSSYNGIGRLYFELGSYDLALKNLKKALIIWKSTLGEKHEWVAEVYDNIGVIYQKQKSLDIALEYFEKSLEIKKEILGYENLELAISYQNIGNVYTEKKSYDLALKSQLKSLNLRKKILGNKNIYVLNNYNCIGQIYNLQKKYNKSLIYYQKALYSNLNNFNDTINIYKNPVLNSCFSPKLLYQTLHLKALTLIELGSSIYLEKALKTYHNCDSLLDKLQASHQTYSDKIELSKSSAKFYVEAINLCKNLFEKTKEEKYIQLAFYFSEKSKNTVLSARINRSKAKSFAGIPDSLLAKENEIKIDLSFYKSIEQAELIKKKEFDIQKLNYSQEKIFGLKREQERIIKLFENRYPKYYEHKHGLKTASLEEIQKLILKSAQTLVEYFVSDSIIYAFIINKNSYVVKELRLTDSLDKSIINLPIYLKNGDFKNYGQVAHQLYLQLIAPLKLKNESLIIVPDGILWHLNFDILLSSKSAGNDFSTLDYLIKKHNISYAYSATLLIQDLNETQKKQPKNECLAFSYSDPSDTTLGNYLAMRSFRNEEKQTLPGTQKEVKEISNVLKGDYYFGSFANERNFKENAKNYNVLHLALHGEIDDTNPMNSKLIFSQNKDSLEDNYLHAFELYNLELNADLAVLSACNTGSGKIEKGEGIMSLGRAFSYAGCKSLLISQWELSDIITPKIMKGFYQNLKEGSRKSEALRNAKLAYLKNADNPSANPYYWASLIQLGNDEPIYPNNQKWWIGLAIIAILIFGGSMYYKRES